ncbi:uncharacterized protein EV154DRAFT_507267 [Mucor mucedo]|uniref:uncharacterized protein n=1 Tax=Mucor mucedo TaxID=29922 RepID=UPI00221FDE9A|nr:uncharacterized protein EV154DRAFT_507267 [Mucor mucedo]KAI7891590.1 hypothetical protein EV154DRAFT_507267 [Mucor mucedo]
MHLLFDSTMDHIDVATNMHLIDQYSITGALVIIEHTIEKFIQESDQHIKLALKQVNPEFNQMVSLSGQLRVSLESVCTDAVEQTKYIRNQMFKDVTNRLHQLIHRIGNELQLLLRN